MIYSSEDYVEMAKAKGLLHVMWTTYILRPTLLTIITNFALTLMVLGSDYYGNGIPVAGIGPYFVRGDWAI